LAKYSKLPEHRPSGPIGQDSIYPAIPSSISVRKVMGKRPAITTANTTVRTTANTTANTTVRTTANTTANTTVRTTANTTANATANTIVRTTANTTANATTNTTANATANTIVRTTANATANKTIPASLPENKIPRRPIVVPAKAGVPATVPAVVATDGPAVAPPLTDVLQVITELSATINRRFDELAAKIVTMKKEVTVTRKTANEVMATDPTKRLREVRDIVFDGGFISRCRWSRRNGKVAMAHYPNVCELFRKAAATWKAPITTAYVVDFFKRVLRYPAKSKNVNNELMHNVNNNDNLG
uniref:DUF4806 domain-containing protein n=1 Tax=Anopheles coluzzii TaxID=1518534 RepID=A0A8W7P997_ANOCL